MKTNFLILVFCWLISVYRAQDVRQSLIVVHVDPAGGPQFKQQIYSYHFLNGNFTGRDELITVQGRKEGKDYIRTDLGRNTFYKNRYLITGIGNIIDLQEKKVLFDGRASLVRCENDSAVFYTNDIFKGKFYSVYDFKKNEYAEVKALAFRARPGRDVEFDKTTSPFKINYYPPGAEKITICEDAGYGQTGTKESHIPDPPLYWLDNNHFVYTYFNKENTELSFYKVNVDSRDAKLLGKVTVSPEKQTAEMFPLGGTRLVMFLGNRQILIDYKEKVVSDLVFTSPDHGFCYECKPSASGRAIKLNDKEIGKLQFRPMNFAAENNIAAVVKEISVGPDYYQQGIVVWNPLSKTWNPVDADEVLRLVGWIKE